MHTGFHAEFQNSCLLTKVESHAEPSYLFFYLISHILVRPLTMAESYHQGLPSAALSALKFPFIPPKLGDERLVGCRRRMKRKRRRR
jgi:hypothetical protein